MEINFNPYWYVPKSIIYKDLVPKAQEFARRDQDMLAAYHMQAFDPAGNPVDARSDQLVRPAKSTTISSASFPGTRTRSAS